MTSSRQPLQGRVFWYGRELERSGDWIHALGAAEQREIAAALAAAKRSGKPLFELGRDDFPLDRTVAFLDRVRDELENGRGMARVRGLDTTVYSEDDLRWIFWGLGAHLGVAVYQNTRGEIMGEVRDETRDAAKTYVEAGPGRITSSRARARSTGPLRFHTDRADAIALLCVRNARAGGISKLASAATVYNEMLARRPDLLELLCQDLWRARPEDEDGIVPSRVFALPLFGVRDGKLTTQYSRTYVEQAQEFPEVPRVTPAQVEAMDLWAEIAESVCLQSPFEPGDLQVLNNHVIYHGRTAYEDDAASHQERLLLRLWLALPNSRALPDGFDTFWGATAPGVLRGGVPQRDQRRAPEVAVGAPIAARVDA
ncbi:MAG: TauD/TfdA family dioxygenase [Proteobacteria bacterium]|nr:TauD/TfdA family dioxygenase [Pseudomonadota bacterium]